MSQIHGYFRTAALVYYSEVSLATVERALRDQGIAVTSVDGRAGLPPSAFDGMDIVLCLYADGSLGSMGNFLSHPFPGGVPLLAVGELKDGEAGSLRAADFIRSINCREKKDVVSASPVHAGGITVDRLRRALDGGEFEMWYQPIVECGTGTLKGFESLVRWRNADTGELIRPDSFIPVIESADIVIPFGFWIIEAVCRQMKQWSESFHCDPPLRVSINLSARQFTCGILAETIVDIIHRYGVDPLALALEITESAFMDDMDAANLMLLKLRAQKIKIYLDDFGTGFSSLSYLVHFPVDVIKIDKSFVTWMNVDEQSEEIVKSVIALAHNLKMQVVAEGVEDEELVGSLRALGCDFIQGYFYSKPLCAPDASDYIASRRPGCQSSADKSS